MKSKSTGRPAGRPEIQATRACPCDSPAVKKRSILTRPPVQSRMNSLIGCAKAIAGIQGMAMEVFRRAAESRVRCDACTLGGPGLQPCLDFVRGPFTGSRFVRAAKAQSLAFYRSSRGASSSTPPRERGIAQLLHRYQNSRILRYQRTAGEKATLYQTGSFRQIARGLALAAGRAGSPARAKRSCNSSGVKVCFAPLRGALQTLRLAVLGLRCAPYPKQEEALEHDASTCSIHPWLGASAFSFGRTLQRWRASASPGSPV